MNYGGVCRTAPATLGLLNINTNHCGFNPSQMFDQEQKVQPKQRLFPTTTDLHNPKIGLNQPTTNLIDLSLNIDPTKKVRNPTLAPTNSRALSPQ